MLILLLLYLLLGTVTGLLAGLFGIGGGLIIVPVLVYLFTLQGFPLEAMMQMALGTSLATISVTAIASIWGHQRHRAILWPVCARLTPGIVLGAALGVAFAESVGSDALRYVFVVFVLLIALQMILGLQPPPSRGLPGAAGMTAAGTGIGGLSMLVGIGGGTLTTPFLLWCNTPLRNAIATSAACGLPIAVAGTLAYMIAGLGVVDLPQGNTGYIHWPAAAAIAAASVLTAPLGAHLTHTLPVKLLKRLFALLLIAVAVRMLML